MSKYFSFLKKKRASLTPDGDGIDKVRKPKKRHLKKSKIDQSRNSMQGLEDYLDRDPINLLTTAKSTSDLQSDNDSLLDNLSEIAAGIIPTFPPNNVSKPLPCHRLSDDSTSGRYSSDSYDEDDPTGSIDEGLAYESICNESIEDEKTPLIVEDDDYSDSSANDIDDFMDEAFDDLTENAATKPVTEESPTPEPEDSCLDIVYSVTEDNQIKFELTKVKTSDSTNSEMKPNNEKLEIKEKKVLIRPTDLPIAKNICDQQFLPSHSKSSSRSDSPNQRQSETVCLDDIVHSNRIINDLKDGKSSALEEVYELANNLVSQSMIDAMVRAAAASSSSTRVSPESVPDTTTEEPLSLDASSIVTSETNSSYISTNDSSTRDNQLNDISENPPPPSCLNEVKCTFCLSGNKDSCSCCFDEPSLINIQLNLKSGEETVSNKINEVSNSSDTIDYRLGYNDSSDVVFEESQDYKSIDSAINSDIYDNNSEVFSENVPESNSVSTIEHFSEGVSVSYCHRSLASGSSVTTSSEIDDEFDSAKEELSDDELEINTDHSSDDGKYKNNNECHTTSKFIINPLTTERYRGGSKNKQTSVEKNSKKILENTHEEDTIEIIPVPEYKRSSSSSESEPSSIIETSSDLLKNYVDFCDCLETTKRNSSLMSDQELASNNFKETTQEETSVVTDLIVLGEVKAVMSQEQEVADGTILPENIIKNDLTTAHEIKSDCLSDINQIMLPEKAPLAIDKQTESVFKECLLPSNKADINGNCDASPTKKTSTISISEDSFLLLTVNSEFDEAEARLAQRRAARAEARELRLRELEKQQQEHENEEEQQYAANANASPNTSLAPPESPVRASSTGRSSVGRASVTKSDGSFSRRSSEESDNDPREVKAELKELDDKFRKAMITNAQLDNEKATLAYEVEFLKDRYSELEETHLQLTKEHKKKCSENEQLRKLTNNLQQEVKAVRKILLERDALIQEYGLVLIGEENGDGAGEDDNPDYTAELEDDTCYNLSPRKIAIKKALLSQEASQLLSKGAAKGSLDVRLKKYAEDKNDLEDEVRRLRLELEEQYNMRRKENGLDYEKQKEASKSINEYKFRVQKAEAEVSTLQANVARLESLTARYKSSTEELELSEEELKTEKRRLQRELRDTQNLLEEIELKNSLMEKRFNKMRNAKSMLLKDLSQDPA